jgi:glucokinase
MAHTTVSGKTRLKSDKSIDGPVRPTGMRHINAREVLWQIRAKKSCSRVELGKLTGMSAPTISALVDYLEKRGLVGPVGIAASGGGRPAELFAVNPKGAYVAGCEISSLGIRCVIADLEGSHVAQLDVPLPTNQSPPRVIGALAKVVNRLLSKHSIARSKLQCICIAAPGMTDLKSGRVVSAPHLAAWTDVPLKELAEDRLKVHSIIENDVNLSAYGEHFDGAAKDETDFVFLMIGSGVGAGIFINGELYRGRRGTAGEIGYMQVPGAERSLSLKNATGSLEEAVGTRGIETAWLKVQMNKSKERLSADQILKLAVSGDARAWDVAQGCATILADAVANVSVLLDPSMIVLGGPIGMAPAIFSEVLKRHEKNDLARPSLVISQLGADAALFGAVRLALEHVELSLLDGMP